MLWVKPLRKLYAYGEGADRELRVDEELKMHVLMSDEVKKGLGPPGRLTFDTLLSVLLIPFPAAASGWNCVEAPWVTKGRCWRRWQGAAPPARPRCRSGSA